MADKIKSFFVLIVVLIFGLLIAGIILNLPNAFDLQSKSVIWVLFAVIVSSLGIYKAIKTVF